VLFMTIMNNGGLTPQGNGNNPFHYLTWVCEVGDDRMRPKGNQLTEGCALTNIRKTKLQLLAKKPNGKKNHVQDKCRNCNRGKRLNGGNTRNWPTKEQAQNHADSANRGWTV